MIRITDKRGVWSHWNSFQDLKTTPIPHQHKDRVRRRFRENYYGQDSTRWFGVKGGAEVVDRLIEYGWPEGVQKGSELMAKLAIPPMPVMRRKRKRGEFGSHLDIHRVYQGQLDTAWETTTRDVPAALKGQNIRVLVDLNASGCQHSEQLFWNGATAATIVKALEDSGRNVKVTVYANCQNLMEGSGRTNFISMDVKEFQTKLPLDMLFSTVALAGFYRIWMFTAWCTVDRRIASGLGPIIRDWEHSPAWEKNVDVLHISSCWHKETAQQRLEQAHEQIVHSKWDKARGERLL